MKKLNFFATSILLAVILFTSCSNASSSNEENNEPQIYYNVGDVILSDGTKVDYADNLTEFTLEQKQKAIAVIFRTGKKGSALGVGLKQGSDLAWAKESTTGYSTKFSDIICTPMSGGNPSFAIFQSSSTWDGDKDGSNNYDIVKAADSVGTLDTATNYPAFNYALNYKVLGATNLSGTIYENGWFLPSIAELVELCESNNKTNFNITVLNKLGNEYADLLGNNSYWSSSQHYYYANRGITLAIQHCRVDETQKDSTNKVLVIRKF